MGANSEVFEIIFYYSSAMLLISALVFRVNPVLKFMVLYYLIMTFLMPGFWFFTVSMDGPVIKSIQFMTLNNLVIFFVLILSLPILRNNNLYVNSSYSSGWGRKDVYVATIVVVLGIVLINAGKPHLLPVLVSEQSPLVVRTTTQALDFPYSLIGSFVNQWEYIALAALIVGYGSEGRKNKSIRIVLIMLLAYMSLSTLRKGAVINIALIFFLYFIFRYGVKRITKKLIFSILMPLRRNSNVLILISTSVFLAAIFVMFVNYGYGVSEVIPGLIERIFLSEFSNIPSYISLYQPFQCCETKYLPSQGASIWGVEQINLEQQLFSDLYPHRGERYGNLPVLGIVSGSKAFGIVLGTLVTFSIYALGVLVIFIFERQARSRGELIFLRTSLSILFMTLFAGGTYRIFSPYTVLSVSLWASVIFMALYMIRVRAGGYVYTKN